MGRRADARLADGRAIGRPSKYYPLGEIKFDEAAASAQE
jgi:hypothetical protein